MEDKERIEYIMLEKGLSNTEFCAKANVSPATLSHILSGRSKPSLAILRGVVNGFPDLNPEWVLMGAGEMYRAASLPQVGGADAENPNLAESQPGTDGDIGGLFAGIGEMHASPRTPIYNKGVETQIAAREKQDHPRQSVSDIVRETLDILQKPQRKIVEVRIFFDDGTYETFSPK